MIRFLRVASLLFLAAVAYPAAADIQFQIGEPAEGSVNSGIGQISGWAVSDETIVSVEALIDGVSLGLVPYGGTRKDVANAFPDIPNAEFSGWAMKWNYALLEEGEHLLTVIVTEDDGDEAVKEVLFQVTGFRSEFIPDPEDVQIGGATIEITPEGKIVIRDVLVEGELVDVELSWFKTAQQFLIDRITYADEPAGNQSPEADAGADRVVGTGEPVSITGSAFDSDGSVVSWSWSQISGPAVDLVNADTAVVEFMAPPDSGDIWLRLTVIDDQGASASDDIVITVEASEPETNSAPTVSAGADRTAQPGDNVTITGSGNDPDGSIVSWAWSQQSGPAAALSGADSAQVSFIAPSTTGDIWLRLTVTDNDGANAFADVIVTIEPAPEPNQAPIADAGLDRVAQGGDIVTITGGGSDPDGSITGWSWSRIAGLAVTLGGSTSQQVSFTAPNTSGTVSLRLTVTDNDGATDSDVVVVTVEAVPEPNQSPTADAGADFAVDQGNPVSITGGGNDPDGSIDNWSWSQQSGPSVTLSGANSQQVSFTAPETAGDIWLRLTVTDNEGATGFDDVVITVNESAGEDQTTGFTHQAMLSVINTARAETRMCGSTEYPGQPPLQWSGSLAEVARIHSMDMAREGYFSHTSLDGTSMGDRVFPYWTGTRVGENIAASSIDRSDSYVVGLWLDSPGHCALIMNPDFTHAGVGSGHNVENGYTYHHFWTLDFGG
jgi:uncharacterized protein YkwD